VGSAGAIAVCPLTEGIHRLRDLWMLIKSRRNAWLVPLLIVLALTGALIVLGSDSLLTPFHYSVF
jgi:Family of unknown function (DUF5989)